MATKRVGSLNPHGAPVLRRQVIANSTEVTEADSVQLTSGFVALGTTGSLVFGHVTAISTDNQVGMLTDGSAGAQFGTFTNTFTTASDNQTADMVTAVCDISKEALYSMTPDATPGTTTGSDLAGYYQDLDDEDTLDESTASTSVAQYLGWGVDPEDSSNVIVNIYESQVFGS